MDPEASTRLASSWREQHIQRQRSKWPEQCVLACGVGWGCLGRVGGETAMGVEAGLCRPLHCMLQLEGGAGGGKSEVRCSALVMESSGGAGYHCLR